MNKICTSIEQSKKLIELGIDISTADMWWSKCTITDFGDGVLKVSYAVEPCNISQFRNTKEDVPAWSLSALLELIHNKIYNLHNSIIGINRYNIWVPERKSPVWTETPLDAVFEMIVWLKENNKINNKI